MTLIQFLIDSKQLKNSFPDFFTSKNFYRQNLNAKQKVKTHIKSLKNLFKNLKFITNIC